MTSAADVSSPAPHVSDCDPLTVDSPLTDVDFDWTHLSETQEPLDPPVGTDDVADIMLTSAGPHLSARIRDDDVMSMPHGPVTA